MSTKTIAVEGKKSSPCIPLKLTTQTQLTAINLLTCTRPPIRNRYAATMKRRVKPVALRSVRLVRHASNFAGDRTGLESVLLNRTTLQLTLVALPAKSGPLRKEDSDHHEPHRPIDAHARISRRKRIPAESTDRIVQCHISGAGPTVDPDEPSDN